MSTTKRHLGFVPTLSFSALPHRHVVPVAGADGLALRLPPLHPGRRCLPGGIEPVPSDPDAPARVGEPDGVQPPAPPPHLGFPDAMAGFHQIDGLTRPECGWRHGPLHTSTVPDPARPHK